MKIVILLLSCCAILGAAPLREFVYTSAPFASAHASTVVELRNGDFEYLDNFNNKRTGHQRLFPAGTVLGGKYTMA